MATVRQSCELARGSGFGPRPQLHKRLEKIRHCLFMGRPSPHWINVGSDGERGFAGRSRRPILDRYLQKDRFVPATTGIEATLQSTFVVTKEDYVVEIYLF